MSTCTAEQHGNLRCRVCAILWTCGGRQATCYKDNSMLVLRLKALHVATAEVSSACGAVGLLAQSLISPP